MERLIDANKLNRKDVNCANVPMNFIDTAPTVDAIPRNQYETRLKADMVAMLEKLQLEIEEKEYLDGEEPINITQDYIDEVKSWEYGKKDCYNIIQQKIDALKGEK